MTGYRHTWGLRIKAARIAAGLRQEDLAEILGIEQSQVSRWERGQNAPRDDLRQELARVLGVDPDSIFSYTNGDEDERVPA